MQGGCRVRFPEKPVLVNTIAKWVQVQGLYILEEKRKKPEGDRGKTTARTIDPAPCTRSTCQGRLYIWRESSIDGASEKHPTEISPQSVAWYRWNP